MTKTVFHEEMTEEISTSLEENRREKPFVKPDVKSEAKPEIKEQTKPEAKPEIKSETPAPEERHKDPPEKQIDNLNAALREEREERKALKKALKEQEEKFGTINQQWQRFQEALSKAKEAQDAPPSLEDNPVENLNRRIEAIAKENEELKRFREEQEIKSVQSSQLQQFQQTVVNAVSSFRKDKPDYDAAYNHVIEIRKAELEMLGVAPEHIPQAIMSWEAQLAALALRNNKNPGEVLYAQAQRYGYKPAETQTGMPAGAPSQGGNSGADDLKRIAKGQEAAKTLSGGSKEAEFSLEALATMDAEEMQEFVSKNWNKLAKAMK